MKQQIVCAGFLFSPHQNYGYCGDFDSGIFGISVDGLDKKHKGMDALEGDRSACCIYSARIHF